MADTTVTSLPVSSVSPKGVFQRILYATDFSEVSTWVQPTGEIQG